MFSILIKRLSIESISYYSLIMFAFTLSLSRAAISFFIVWFVILVLLKKDYKNSFQVLKENKIFTYIGLFFLFIFLSTLWSEDIENMIRHLRLYSYWIIVPCIVILGKKQWIYQILNAFLIGMFISEILSYGIFFELWSIDGSSPNQPSPFMTTIHYSVFLAFTSLILLYRFLFENTELKLKISLFLFFILTTINLMISTGRTGQLAFFITLFVVFVIRYKISIKTFLLSSILFISIVFISYNGLNLFKMRIDASISDVKNVVSNQNYATSWGLRAGWWILAFDALKEKPFLGYGLGDYKIAAKEMIEKHDYPFMDQKVKDFLTSHHYHNQYLMIVVEGGLIALSLFLLFIYKMFRLNIDDLEIKHIGIIGITVLLIAFIGDPLLFLQFPLVLFLFIMSIIILSAKK